MKRIIITAIVFAMLFFPMSALCSDDAGYTYKSATEYDYPPFSVTTDGNADGFSVELLKEVADVMGLRISFKVDSWANIKEELKEGKLDVLPLVGYTQERDEYLDFSVPYIIMHGNIFIRTDNTDIRTEDDLFGKRILVMEGDSAHEYAVRKGLGDELTLTSTYREAFELLASGKYDAVLAQSLVGEQLISQMGLSNVKAATRIDEDGLTEIRTNLSGFEQKFCFAVREGDKELLSKLNEGLAIVSTNGTFDRLYIKWFPFLTDTKPSFHDIADASVIVILPVLLITLILVVIFVRRHIKQKTLELEKSNRAMLEMESHLRSQQKLESVGVLASGVAHEINNPLNGILNYGQVILDIVNKDELDCNEFRESIGTFSKEIIKESDRISGVVENLLQFSRTGSKRFVETQIADIINNILNLIDTVIKQDQIALEIDVQQNLPKIECRSQEIQQVLLNLIINAKDALNAKYKGFDEKKIINVKVSKITDGEQKMIRIIVRDNGNGIPKDIGDNIFDPFFTTKNRSEGTGLGLYISFGIVRDHGGQMSFKTKQGEFTQFIVDLPLKQKNEGDEGDDIN